MALPPELRWIGGDTAMRAGAHHRGREERGRAAPICHAATVKALATEVGRESGVAQWIDPDGYCAGGAQRAGVGLFGRERSYITDMAFAMRRVQRLMGDRSQAAGPPPIGPEDASGVHRFGRGDESRLLVRGGLVAIAAVD
jgi:hypothetical protein